MRTGRRLSVIALSIGVALSFGGLSGVASAAPTGSVDQRTFDTCKQALNLDVATARGVDKLATKFKKLQREEGPTRCRTTCRRREQA